MHVVHSEIPLRSSKFNPCAGNFPFMQHADLNSRHLVRLWLRDEELAWKTPLQLQDRWDKVYGGVTAENQVFPLEPFLRAPSSGEQPRAAE